MVIMMVNELILMVIMMVIMNNIILCHGYYMLLLFIIGMKIIRNMILKQLKSSSVVAGSRTEKHSQPQSQTCRFASSAPKQSTCHSPVDWRTGSSHSWFNHGSTMGADQRKGVPYMGIPPNERFLMENPIKMDVLEVPLFQETSISELYNKESYKSHISYIYIFETTKQWGWNYHALIREKGTQVLLAWVPGEPRAKLRIAKVLPHGGKSNKPSPTSP